MSGRQQTQAAPRPADSPIPQEARRQLAVAFQRLAFENVEEQREHYAELVSSGEIGPLYWDQADTFAAWFRDRLDVVHDLIARSRR